jgi:hypothetical protein
MTPDHISKRIVIDRLDLVSTLLQEIRDLPLGDEHTFFADRRNVWAAESCLRRSLEALFDRQVPRKPRLVGGGKGHN